MHLSKYIASPLRALSISRLKLQASLMAARLAVTIRAESNCFSELYTGHIRPLYLLCYQRTYSMFVIHKLGEIYELTEIAAWNWVHKQNPADSMTRDGKLPEPSPEGVTA